ncbi:related to Ethanolamine-phosphate cytidylyltransferase [Zygosaccharomyces bailii]|nr:related to Ethanolamine-phosphate cytidylyltransferase [Zygosaccharomyces bailii]
MTAANENRVWIDGCFDFTHHGHAGAILQARRTINPDPLYHGWLVCGVHNDQAIAHHKGTQPVMNQRERYEHTRANKWCNQVVEDAPYVTQPAWLDRYCCLYVVHGDDVTLDANGENCYREVMQQGRFRVVKRTAGVSTTEIIHRILNAHSDSGNTSTAFNAMPPLEKLEAYSSDSTGYNKHCYVFKHDLNHELVKGGYPFDSDACLFVIGDLDLFHMGHIEKLKSLASSNRKLIVSIQLHPHSIMTLNEIALSVLSCRYVDGVVLDATPQFCDSLSPQVVSLDTMKGGPSFGYLTKQTIVERILNNRQEYTERNKRKGLT